MTAGIEGEVKFVVPARLAEMLRRDELDAALVSVAEVIFNDRYDVLDQTAIASSGAVFSVHLAHRRPLTETTLIHCDVASLTGVNLLRVLLAERGLKVQFRPLRDYARAVHCDAVLLIGDRAIDFRLGPHPHQILDLGEAWYDLTGLPFVYAVWALRRGIDQEPLRRALLAAKARGLSTLAQIIRCHRSYTPAFRERYFRQHVQFDLGSLEKAGVARFIELLRKHGLGPVYEPRYVA